jgi:iron complex transport system substrate-binding protein
MPVLALLLALGGGGCVNQRPDETALLAAENQAGTYRLVATSRAVVEICDRLELELAGAPELAGLPERYAGVTRTGSPMSPDLEIIKLIAPTEVAGPDMLQSELEPAYANAGLPATFLNLRTVRGLYDSVEYLGNKYGAGEQARAMLAEYSERLAALETARDGRPGPRVLILMGMPGAYVECTSNSYVGNLVEACGGINVTADPVDGFVNWNTEDLLLADPDIILRTAHALPEQVAEMFGREFAENDIWKHFRAVQAGRVYDLNHAVFSTSANFRWPEAFARLEEIFYGGAAS